MSAPPSPAIPAGALWKARTPGAFNEPAFPAVDQSTGDVYVADRSNDVVTKFTEDGEVVSSWGDDGPGEESDGRLIGPKGKPSEQFGELRGIAVDFFGNLWVDCGAPSQHLFEFDHNGGFEIGWTPETASREAFNLPGWGIAVDSEDNLYIALTKYTEGADFKFSSTGSLIGAITESERENKHLSMVWRSILVVSSIVISIRPNATIKA